MASLQSKLVIWLIKNRHLLKMKLKPEIVDDTFSVQKFRNSIDKASVKMKPAKDVEIEEIKIDNIYAEWIKPKDCKAEKVLLYIHGGGFISGSCHTHRAHVSKFARGADVKTLLFDYRLAPEHPFPAALDDCVKAYGWLIEQDYKPNNIVIGGESAGGTLVFSLLLALKDQNFPLPCAAFSISPLGDLRCKAESFVFNADNDVAPKGSWNVWTSYYIADNDPLNPLLSPVFGNFQGFPPLYLCVGTHEIHLTDCENLSNKAIDQNVEITFVRWDKMIHAFPLLSPMFPEAKQAMHEICEFIKKYI